MIKNLNINENINRDLYLKGLAIGKIEGPLTGKPNQDKIWLKNYSDEQIKSKLPECSIYDYLYKTNKEYLDDEALIYFSKKWKYNELFEMIDKVASSFNNLGLKKGDTVTVVLPNIPEIVFMFYALNKLGIKIHLMHPISDKNKIIEGIKSVDSKCLIIYSGIANNINNLDKIKNIKEFTNIKNVIVANPANYMPLSLKTAYNVKTKISEKNKDNKNHYINWDEFLKLSNNYVPNNFINPNDEALFFNTGGTTGTSKLAVHTHNTFNSSITQIQLDNPIIERGDKIALFMPIFHGFGASNCMHLGLCSGVTSVLLPSFKKKLFIDTIYKNDINNILGVPLVFELIKNSKKLKKKNWDNTKYMINGGDKMTKPLYEDYAKFLESVNSPQPLLNAWGLAETVGAVSRTRSDILKKDNLKVNASNVGIPFLKNNIMILNLETNEENTYGETGEICVNGPSVMKHYHNNLSETNNTFFKDKFGQSWLKTGDLGFIDKENGCLYFVDREKNVIINNGINVYPVEIEATIGSLDMIEKLAVVGVPAGVNGEKIIMYVELKEKCSNVDNTIETIKNECINKLPSYSIPHEIHIVDKLPLTPMNKIDRVNLKNIYKSNNNSKTLKKSKWGK